MASLDNAASPEMRPKVNISHTAPSLHSGKDFVWREAYPQHYDVSLLTDSLLTKVYALHIFLKWLISGSQCMRLFDKRPFYFVKEFAFVVQQLRSWCTLWDDIPHQYQSSTIIALVAYGNIELQNVILFKRGYIYINCPITAPCHQLALCWLYRHVCVLVIRDVRDSVDCMAQFKMTDEIKTIVALILLIWCK